MNALHERLPSSDLIAELILSLLCNPFKPKWARFYRSAAEADLSASDSAAAEGVRWRGAELSGESRGKQRSSES